MLVVSDSIKNAYNQYTTQRKSYIQIGNNSFFVQNLDVYAECYNEGNVIGNAIAKIAKFDIETVNISNIDTFELFDGIWTGNQYEYVSLGTFKLFNEKGTDDFFSSITAYDQLLYFNKEYDPSQTSYPTTIYGLLQSICLQAGVELENVSISNGEQIIESNLFVENETLKTILNAICQISGTFGMISKDKLKLLLKGTDTIELSKYQLSSPEYKRTTWAINQVILGMESVEGEYVKYPDDAKIQGSIHKLVINDNPFVYTQALRESYIQNLYNQVNGFGYVAFDTQCEGLPYVELGDLVNLEGRESIVLRYNLKSPQGLKSTLSAPSIIDSVVQYADNSNSIANKQKKTEITEDKQNQIINATVEKVDEHGTAITNLQIRDGEIQTNIDDANGNIAQLKASVEGLTNTVSNVGGGNLIKDSLGALNDGSWSNSVSTVRDTYTLGNSIAGQGIMLNANTIEQKIQLPNEVHTLSFKYKKLLSTINAKLYVNDAVFNLDQIETTEFIHQINAVNNSVTIKFECDTNNGCYILDLMLNLGSTKDVWTQNANETSTDTVKIGKGIQVESSRMNTYFRADADGTRVINRTTGEPVREDTDKGTITNEFTSRSTSIVNGVLFTRVGNQVWESVV